MYSPASWLRGRLRFPGKEIAVVPRPLVDSADWWKQPAQEAGLLHQIGSFHQPVLRAVGFRPQLELLDHPLKEGALVAADAAQSH